MDCFEPFNLNLEFSLFRLFSASHLVWNLFISSLRSLFTGTCWITTSKNSMQTSCLQILTGKPLLLTAMPSPPSFLALRTLLFERTVQNPGVIVSFTLNASDMWSVLKLGWHFYYYYYSGRVKKKYVVLGAGCGLIYIWRYKWERKRMFRWLSFVLLQHWFLVTLCAERENEGGRDVTVQLTSREFGVPRLKVDFHNSFVPPILSDEWVQKFISLGVWILERY